MVTPPIIGGIAAIITDSSSTMHNPRCVAVPPLHRLYQLTVLVALLCWCYPSEMTSNTDTVRVSAWNCRGLVSSRQYITKLLCASDILALSEHKLYACELNRLCEISDDFVAVGKSSEDLDPEHRDRVPGHGGVAILWRKTMAHYIRPVKINSDRICGIEICRPNNASVFIISVYMPQQRCVVSDYQTHLDILEQVTDHCRTLGEVIIVGDWNARICREYGPRGSELNSPNGEKVLLMLERCSLVVADLQEYCSGPLYTYLSDTHPGVTSYIDHIMVTKGAVGEVRKCAVIEDELINTSDHLPLSVELVVSNIMTRKLHSEPVDTIAWHKLNKTQIQAEYTDILELHMQQYMDSHRAGPFPSNWTQGDISQTYTDLVTILTNTGRRLQTKKQNRNHKHHKHYWTNELSALSREKRATWQQWKLEGKPPDPTNPHWVRYKDAKREFRREQRRAVYRTELQYMEKLEKLAYDQKSFWAAVNRKLHKKGTYLQPLELGNGVIATDPTDILEGWRAYFLKLYTPQEQPHFDEPFRLHVEEQMRGISTEPQHDDTELLAAPIRLEEVQDACKKLKCGKAAGYDGIQPEHLKHAGPMMQTVLLWLFRAMVHLEWRPVELKKGVIIPIPKGQKDSTVPSNNRGITLMPIIGKMYDSILLKRAETWFDENFDPMQGANRKGRSSLETAALVQEALAYNTSHNSTVYIALMDIMKAFDTVWLDGLFFQLHQKNMDRKLWRIIRNAYGDFECCVSVGGSRSDWFVPKQGVHQGDVMSMRLHSVYIDGMISFLKGCTCGSTVGPHDITCPAFADDIAAMALSKPALVRLLVRALRYSGQWRFVISPEKTVFQVHGPDTSPELEVAIGTNKVQCVEGTLHVGVPLCVNRKAEVTLVADRITACRRKFYAIKGISSAAIRMPTHIVSRLYMSICVPKLTYGAEVWTPSDANMHDMEKFHQQMGRQIQGLSPTASGPTSYSPLGWDSIEALFDMAKLMYLLRLLAQPYSSAFRRLATDRLTESRFGQNRKGPCAELWKVVSKYHLVVHVKHFLDSGTLMSKARWKGLVTAAVRSRQYQRWRMTCLLYKSMDIVTQCVVAVGKPCLWWTVCRVNPDLDKACRQVVRVLSADHSLNSRRGRFVNHSKLCQLCSLYVTETVSHTLFVCPRLEDTRSVVWTGFLQQVPPPMRECVLAMTYQDRTEFILSGFRSQYINDWQPLYETIARFVACIFRERQCAAKQHEQNNE